MEVEYLKSPPYLKGDRRFMGACAPMIVSGLCPKLKYPPLCEGYLSLSFMLSLR